MAFTSVVMHCVVHTDFEDATAAGKWLNATLKKLPKMPKEWCTSLEGLAQQVYDAKETANLKFAYTKEDATEKVHAAWDLFTKREVYAYRSKLKVKLRDSVNAHLYKGGQERAMTLYMLRSGAVVAEDDVTGFVASPDVAHEAVLLFAKPNALADVNTRPLLAGGRGHLENLYVSTETLKVKDWYVANKDASPAKRPAAKRASPAKRARR